jgi:hypothetical protein
MVGLGKWQSVQECWSLGEVADHFLGQNSPHLAVLAHLYRHVGCVL